MELLPQEEETVEPECPVVYFGLNLLDGIGIATVRRPQALKVSIVQSVICLMKVPLDMRTRRTEAF